MSPLRQNDVATSLWRNNDFIFVSCAHWASMYSWDYKLHINVWVRQQAYFMFCHRTNVAQRQKYGLSSTRIHWKQHPKQKKHLITIISWPNLWRWRSYIELSYSIFLPLRAPAPPDAWVHVQQPWLYRAYDRAQNMNITLVETARWLQLQPSHARFSPV